MNLLNFVVFLVFGKKLEITGPSLTFVRLCTSRHLRDLQQIASLTIVLYFFVFALVLFLKTEFNYQLLALSALTSTAAAVLSWAYQLGSRRIGSVDLFANEIGVICRVCLIVDFADHSVGAVKLDMRTRDGAGQPVPRTRFSSEEHYTPVYDKNVSDLQPLDVDVVTSVTRFYTYRKTMMDYLRLISVTDDKAALVELRSQMIYMQYLMYESAREAITLLIEFEPNQAENIINVLCSEFVLFSFLKTMYRDDFRNKRLELRVDEYAQIMAVLGGTIHQHVADLNWKQAQATFPELVRRYRAMCEDLGLSFSFDI
jgi:hypothetical protein